MKYYLDVSSLIVGWQETRDEMLRWIRENTTVFSDSSSGWVDIDQSIISISTQLFKQLRLRPVHVGLYVSRGSDNHSIHTHPTNEHARLNIPLLNCDNTHTVFYHSTQNPVPVMNAQGVSLYSFSPECCIEIARTTIDKPTVLHIRTPHQVIAPLASMDNPRIMSTFQFNRDPVFLLK